MSTDVAPDESSNPLCESVKRMKRPKSILFPLAPNVDEIIFQTFWLSTKALSDFH